MADGLKVGFVGGGNMAKAMAKGFISAKIVEAGNIIVSATTKKTLDTWKVIRFPNSRTHIAQW